jgi:hypothetical protein
MERDYHLRFILHRSADSMEWFHLRGDLLEYVRIRARNGPSLWDVGGMDYQEQPGDVGPHPEEAEEFAEVMP